MAIDLTAGGGGGLVGLTSAAANTPWFAVIPARFNFVTRLASLETNNGATNNGVYLMRPIGGATVLTAAAAAATSLVLDRDPSGAGNAVASGDQIVYLATDGTYRRVTAGGALSGLTLTVSALPVGVAAGAGLWNFGVFTDTDPTTGAAFPLLSTPTSQVYTRTLSVGFGGATGEPLILYSPNATNQTTLNFAEYAHTPV